MTQTKTKTIKLSKEMIVPLYLPFLNSFDKDIEIFMGSRNSAKSYFVYQKHIVKALNEKGSSTLFIRKYRNTLKQSCFKSVIEMLKVFKIHDACNINYSELTITLPNDSTFSFAGADNPDSIKSMLSIDRIIFEECDSISIEEYEVISGSMRGTGTKLETFIFNPPTHEFWLFKTYMNWLNLDDLYEQKIMENERVRVVHSTWKDNPFQDLKRLEIKYSAMRERDYYRWLRDSEGRIGNSEAENTVIPYESLVGAFQRTINIKPSMGLNFGVDVARFGTDSTVITPVFSDSENTKVLPQIKLKNKRGHEIADIVLKEILKVKTKYNYTGSIRVIGDGTGLGASFIDALELKKKEQGLKWLTIIDFNFSQKAQEEDLYSNGISELAFQLRDLLQDGCIDISESKELAEECTNRLYHYDSKNRQIIEKKDDYKKRMSKSPDSFDSLLLALYVRKNKFIFV